MRTVQMEDWTPQDCFALKCTTEVQKNKIRNACNSISLPSLQHPPARQSHQSRWQTVGGARLTAQLQPTYLSRHDLSAGAPDSLEETILLCQPVERVVALAHGADEAAEGICLVLAGVAAVLVDLADADLDGGVVLGLDDAAGGAALAGDVAGMLSVYIYPYLE